MPQHDRHDLRGARLGPYRLLAPLGIGGTGVVFAAVRVRDHAPVVVKVLRETYAFHSELAKRLQREALVARRVGHPGLVRLFDQGTLEDGSPYLVMERLRGECLARLLKRHGPLDGDLVATIAVRVAAILHAAHAEGYVHRDVKPEHIVLCRTPEGRLDVRLIDFGVCSSADATNDEREKERGRVYGTPSYVSPEQAAGRPDVDARTDVYGLGTFMFEALTGRVPFRGDTVSELLRKIIRQDAPPASLYAVGVDPRLDTVVGRAMSRIPHHRFPTMRPFARSLMPLIADRAEAEARLGEMVRHRSPAAAEGAPTRPRARRRDPSRSAVA